MRLSFFQSVLQEFIEDVKRRNAWKSVLRAANQNVDNRPEESDFHKLDSSLKKNTAFIRKLVGGRTRDVIRDRT